MYSAAASSVKFPRPEISAGAYILSALLVLVLPLNWLLGWLLAVTVHELGHIIALRLFKVRIYGMRIGVGGMKLDIPPLTPAQELICAAAGPVSSIPLLALAHHVPTAAVIGLFQGMFNLLPLYPLDGGRMCRAVWILLRERGR